jgi:hypothetical protein
MLRQLGCGGPKLEVGLDVVEGRGAHDTFIGLEEERSGRAAADNECSFKARVF